MDGQNETSRRQVPHTVGAQHLLMNEESGMQYVFSALDVSGCTHPSKLFWTLDMMLRNVDHSWSTKRVSIYPCADSLSA